MRDETFGVAPVFDEETIASRIAALGASIRSDAGASEVTLLAVLKGSAVFLADLIRAIPGPVAYEFIDVIRDENDTAVAAATEIDFLTHFAIRGRNVIVLKDVVTTGVIETYLLSQLRQKGPAGLKLAALLDRPGMRTSPLEVDYAAFQVEGGTFVGYGLEYGGRHGNLRFIGRL